MKITPFHPQDQIQAGQPRRNQAISGETDFAKILDENQKATSSPQAAAGQAASLLSGGLAGLLMTSQATQVSATDQARTPEAQLEQTLSVMEEYAEALGNPQKTLKEVAPLAEDLGREADLLSKLSQKMAPDSPLWNISNETAVRATVEAMKFKRGDFV